ncbi:MAG: IS110 family transposase [Eubacterium sp.]
MNAVGIDISKGRSMVAVARPGEVIAKPFTVFHTRSGIHGLIDQLTSLEGDTRIVIEHTGRYYEPMAQRLCDAGFFVSAVNPKLIKDYGHNSLRKVKTDKADAKKIAGYTLDNWLDLRQYTGMDTLRKQLKTMNTQLGFYTKQKTAAKNNLIALLDQTYPGVNAFFESPARSDGSQKWVDFAKSFWHVDCVCQLGPATFTKRYQKWCLRHGYNYQSDKAQAIFDTSGDLIAMLPKNDLNKMLVMQGIEQLNTVSTIVEKLKTEMNTLASELPEYPVVMAMRGVGPCLGPQIMAEIGDISRFSHKSALTAFAGVDPGANQSGDYEAKSNHASKRGSPRLRKALFMVMDCLIKTSPPDDPVYCFMDKKRSEGKPYLVYMTAGANKFLRIYYGRVKDYLASLPPVE